MSDTAYRVAGTTATLRLALVDNITPANNPVTGATAEVSLRRASDDKWFDFISGLWDVVASYAALGAEHKEALTDKSDGSYEFDWNQQAADAGAEREYEAYFKVTGGSFQNMVTRETEVFSKDAAAALAAVGLDKSVIVGQQNGTPCDQGSFNTNIYIGDTANNVRHALRGWKCLITSGVNAGQSRFVGSTQTVAGKLILEFDGDYWDVAPELGATFVLLPAGPDGAQVAGMPGTVSMPIYGSETTKFIPLETPSEGAFVGSGLRFWSGANVGEVRNVLSCTFVDGGGGFGAWQITTAPFAHDMAAGDHYTIGDPILTQQDIADAGKLAPAVGAPAAGSVYELLSNLETGTEPDGFPCPVTVTVDGVPTLGIAVTLQSAGPSTTHSTDANGVATQFVRPEGSYTITIPGGNGHDDYSGTLTVSALGAVTGDEVDLDVTALPVATDPARCRCYLDMFAAGESAAVGVGLGRLAVTKIIDRPAGDTRVYSCDEFGDNTGGLTDSNGRAYLDIPRGMVCRVKATYPDSSTPEKEVAVPDAASYDMGVVFPYYVAVVTP